MSLVIGQLGRGLTDAGVSAAARLCTGDTTEEDLQLRVQQSHIFTSEDLRHTGQDGVNAVWSESGSDPQCTAAHKLYTPKLDSPWPQTSLQVSGHELWCSEPERKKKRSQHDITDWQVNKTPPYLQPIGVEPGCTHPHHGARLLWKQNIKKITFLINISGHKIWLWVYKIIVVLHKDTKHKNNLFKKYVLHSLQQSAILQIRIHCMDKYCLLF